MINEFLLHLPSQEFNILPVESSNFKLAMQQGIQTHETVHVSFAYYSHSAFLNTFSK